MATLVKIRGLDRSKSAVADGGSTSRGFRVASGLGSQYPAGVKATLTPTANTQSYTAKYGGTFGNAFRIQTATGTLAVTVTYTASTGAPVILVTAPATATLAANQAVVAAVNANPEASQYVTAALAGTGAAAHAIVASTVLAGGTDVGTAQDVFLVVKNNTTVTVDVDNAKVARTLKRNGYRFVSLGAA